jgi:hypothetical protein
MMNARRASFNNLCGAKPWKILQPKTGTLRFGMPELPRLDALGELDVVSYEPLRVGMHDGVFDADVWDRSIQEVGKQLSAFTQFLPHLSDGFAGRCLVQPSDSAIAQARAWWMGDDEEVPAVIQDVPHVALDMAVAVALGGKQVTRPRIVAFFQKRISHDAGEFTGDKHPENSLRRVRLIGESLHEFLHEVVDRSPQRKPMPRQAIFSGLGAEVA